MAETAKSGASRPGVLALHIKEKPALYAAYMPYIRGGGIFIPTNRLFNLGDEVFMLLTLLDDVNKLAVSGKVVWLTPGGAQDTSKQGIGVKFSDNDSGHAARAKIESLIAPLLKTDKPTHTM